MHSSYDDFLLKVVACANCRRFSAAIESQTELEGLLP